ncbi:MAG: hypothetical protein NVS3B10_03230 [Polyangiales bacterium]
MSFAPKPSSRSCPACKVAVPLASMRACPVCGADLAGPASPGAALVESLLEVIGDSKGAPRGREGR